MGKKLLKSNRHKKLKAVDPFYTGERKLLLDKGLLNANQAPKNDDEKLPSKLRECLELRDQLHERKRDIKRAGNGGGVKSVRKIKGRKQLEKAALNQLLSKEPDDKGAEQPASKPVKFERYPNESDTSFLNRIERETQAAINKSRYEAQFDVKIETRGDKVIVKKDKKMSERKRRQLDKLKTKLKNKKLNSKMERDNKEFKTQENIKFGDIADAPPEFTALPKQRAKKVCPTITAESVKKNGITESDRNAVIQRYRLMKSQGKFGSK